MQDFAGDLNLTAKDRIYALSGGRISIVRWGKTTRSLSHTDSEYWNLPSEVMDYFTTNSCISVGMTWSWTDYKLSRPHDD